MGDIFIPNCFVVMQYYSVFQQRREVVMVFKYYFFTRKNCN